MKPYYSFFNLLSIKVVMITGASSGLGEAMAYVFYNCGCRLILVARRKQELQRVKDSLLNLKVVSIFIRSLILYEKSTNLSLIITRNYF